MMRLRSIRNIKHLHGKRVILRLDLNAPIKHGRMDASDMWKLRAAVPTLDYLHKQGAIVIILSHLGRPKGFDHALSMKHVVKKLAIVVGSPIQFWVENITICSKKIQTLAPSSIVALENIRFHHEEYTNDAHFAKRLASLGDVYVNDAFGVIHRSQASLVAITHYIPSYSGLLVEQEIAKLYDLIKHARRPIVAIMGGNKISTKIRLIKKFLRHADWVLLGGALANTVLAGLDYKVGKSSIEHDMISWSKSVMDNKLKLPVDTRVATSKKAKDRIVAIAAVRKNDIIFDVGPDTVALYGSVIAKANTVVWNGPLGYFEDKRYARATVELVKHLAASKAKVYLGGGETVKAVLDLGLESKFEFMSSGGGAMLTVLENRPMPALRALQIT